MSCCCLPEFYKCLKIFGVQTGGGGGFTPAFGEMMITSNTRATQGAFPTEDWIKPEAGDPLSPAAPPLYTLYGPGDNIKWGFDQANGRLIYLGEEEGYYKITCTFAVALDSGLSARMGFALIKNDDDLGTLLDKSFMPVTVPEGYNGVDVDNSVLVTLQAFDFFQTNDYVNLVLQNNDTANLPIVAEMNFTTHKLGDLSVPAQQVFIVSDQGENISDNTDTPIIGEEF